MAEEKEEVVSKVLNGVEEFTIDLYKMIASKTKENLVSSALCAHLVLSMAAYGARDITAKEMRRVLRLPDGDDEAHREFKEVIDTMNNFPNVTLKLATKVFASDSITMKDEFRKLTEAYFHSESEGINFHDPIESTKMINEWCFDKTHGKIEKILSPGDVTPDLAMILLNAVYFRGNWKYPFKESWTKLRPFHITKNRTIRVPTMHIVKTFLYKKIQEPNAQCVILPYDNENVVMEIIVPEKINDLEHIDKYLEKIHEKEESKYCDTEIELSLPRFKIESTIDLKEHLQEMGMKDMFTDKANFTNISDKNLKVSKVLQKAYIEVNEEGTEAVSLTAVSMRMYCLSDEPPVVKVDRPFFFRISIRNCTIFSGHVVNPTYGENHDSAARRFSGKISKCSII